MMLNECWCGMIWLDTDVDILHENLFKYRLVDFVYIIIIDKHIVLNLIFLS
jgi:hypothetical protein